MLKEFLQKPYGKVAIGTLILAIFVLMVHFGCTDGCVGLND